MELANIVRNKDWFDITVFFVVTGKRIKTLSKTEVEQKFGIKYIGNLLK